jgi:hypothetical protein
MRSVLGFFLVYFGTYFFIGWSETMKEIRYQRMMKKHRH